MSDPGPLKFYTIAICTDCYELRGEMCHNPGCAFCRRTMTEVARFLGVLLIRPVVDGKRLRLGSPISAEAVTRALLDELEATTK